jgi:hypothetical protein
MNIQESYNLKVLLETLDKPYSLTDITDKNDHIVQHLRSVDGATDIKLQAVDVHPEQTFISYLKDGAYEIHHHVSRDAGQFNGKNISKTTPSKFVSTVFDFVKSKVDDGHPVRIISADSHFNVYHRLSKIISNKHGFSVTDGTKDSDGNNVFTISKEKFSYGT